MNSDENRERARQVKRAHMGRMADYVAQCMGAGQYCPQPGLVLHRELDPTTHVFRSTEGRYYTIKPATAEWPHKRAFAGYESDENGLVTGPELVNFPGTNPYGYAVAFQLAHVLEAQRLPVNS